MGIPRESHRTTAAYVRLLLALGSLALAGCMTYPHVRISAEQYPEPGRSRVRHNLAVFYRVWDLVNRKHYEPKTHGIDWEREAATFEPRVATAPNDQALYATINEMLEQLHDSHTHALTPAQWTEFKTRQRVRTGFAVLRIEQHWVVADLLPGSPAAKAGVQNGWVVIARNGHPLGDRPDFSAIEGEEVRWSFLDQQDHRVDVAVRATRLSIAPLQEERELPGGWVYLRFDEFDGVDRRWLSRQLVQHRNAPGVIVDLRRNSGGGTPSLGIAVGEFFHHAVDCGTFVTRDGARSVENSEQFRSANYQGKVAILVDANTASAAEIFAAVMQNYHRAILVGRKTAGAVLASWFYHLPGGGALQLSFEDYIAPSGHRIEGNGVEPDIVVARTLAEARAGGDADLDAAIRSLSPP